MKVHGLKNTIKATAVYSAASEMEGLPFNEKKRAMRPLLRGQGSRAQWEAAADSVGTAAELSSAVSIPTVASDDLPSTPGNTPLPVGAPGSRPNCPVAPTAPSLCQRPVSTTLKFPSHVFPRRPARGIVALSGSGTGSGTGQRRLLPRGCSQTTIRVNLGVCNSRAPRAREGGPGLLLAKLFRVDGLCFPRCAGWAVRQWVISPRDLPPSDLGLAPRPGRLGPWSHLPVRQLPWEKPGHSNYGATPQYLPFCW